jgi:alkanesulfonate monooxygenase SsuD/methylene tetrahydromethanopterin reductase-like flavin-dependent oxidoreductase (luciferase family)
MAMQTEQVRIGAVLHPLAWRRPWLLARDAATLDRLSNGRLVVPVGLGAVEGDDFARGRTRFGEPVDRRVRAQLLDEGLEILSGLWSGHPVTFHGAHYHLDDFSIQLTPVQSPRVPIWVVGVWGRRQSMQRVLRCDGILAASKMDRNGTSSPLGPDDIGDMTAFIREHRTLATPFDVVMEGDTRGADAAQARETVRAWAEAGVTWWLETMWSGPNDPAAVRARLRQGPPRIDY